ncbi:DNA polymerase beta [Mucor ambiguus]|uniref:DNA polymerase n=1 Tax=Mucor ambiguus TaxID=91626 RepID=A0A0C9MT17_9FUNG|nr:DNA polymerase beta [Mucor ambiguus]
MSKIFQSIRAYIIPVKLSEYEVGAYTHLIEKHGGKKCVKQGESTHIFTILKSSTRISRNVESHQVPVIDIQWIRDCDKKQQLLPIETYTIITDRKKLRSSSSDHDALVPSLSLLTTSTATTSISSGSNTDILNRRFKDSPPEDLPFSDESGSTRRGEGENVDLAPGFINTKYECLRPTPYEPKYNKKLVSLLLLLERKRQIDNELKRSLSYRHAISAIKAYPREIQSSKEAEKIIGVGSKIAEKIKVFLHTGTIEEADQLRYDEEFRTISLFNKVFGVGATTARIWWELGYKTLQEVLDNAKLSTTIKLGIELLPDFDQMMSQQDVKEIIDIVTKEVVSINSECFVVPVGGYRRGKTKNGDVDLIISSKNAENMRGFLNKLTQRLIEKDYLKHKLWHSTDIKNLAHAERPSSVGGRQQFDNFEKCFCAFLQPSTGIHRQVDLICVVNPDELATAILGWTGSRQFERAIRDYAKKEKNMSLNSQAIHFEQNGKKNRFVVHSEKDAFDIIGMPYLEPEFRNC